MNERELMFYEGFTKATGLSLIFEPTTFYVRVEGVDYRYTPDFYCPENLTFYEVVGSRQAFHHGKFKIKAFAARYPQIKLEIVTPAGEAYGFKSLNYRGNKSLPAIAHIPIYLKQRTEIADRLGAFMLESGLTATEVGKGCGLTPSVITSLISGKTRRPHPVTTANILKFIESWRQDIEEAAKSA